jgi:hypothetical protein
MGASVASPESVMDNLKSFDPNDIDESLTRVVTHGGDSYLMFPYINAIGTAPKFKSITCVIDGPAATIDDFLALSAMVRLAGENAGWFISFNTPWLIGLSEAANVKPRTSQGRAHRE